MEQHSSRPLTVQFDAQLLTWQRHGGISNYFAHIVSEFNSRPTLGIHVSGVPQFTRNPQAMELGMGRPIPRVFLQRVRTARMLNAPLQWRAAMRKRDVLHYTYYANRQLTRKPGLARVVTVHDMIPEKFPELFPNGNPHQHKLRHVLAADLVLCISKTTSDDLLEMVPEVADRVRITPLGVSRAYFARPDAHPISAPTRPFLLFVGMRTFHKNFDVVLRALLQVDPAVELVLAGGGPLSDAEAERVRHLGLAARVRQVTPSDEELRTLYRTALAFVFTSTYEGFGLPVMEAMASGCPAVLSRIAVFKEIAGPDADFFDPDDDGALAEAAQRLLNDASHRTALIEAGRRRAERFTWSHTAAATASAYRDVVND